MADQPRRFTASGYLGDGWQRIRRDDPESSSALRNGSGALVPTLSALDKIMARFDQLEFKLDARDRRVDRLKATRLPKPDQPYFSDDGDVDGYRSQGDVWPTDEDGPPVFNHGRRVRCGDVRRRRGTGRDLNRREAGLAQPGSGTIPYRAHTASWPRTSWDRPAARVTTEFDRGFRGYRQPTSWDPPINRPSCWDPPGNRPIPSFQPYDPPRSWQPSCWEPPPHRASQGYSDYDQPPQCLPSRWDTPRRQTDHFRQQRSPRPSTQPWRPEIMGFEEKMVDEEFCYEIELIPGCHSSSLDQESDAHQEKNDSSNWMGSFLEEADDSKSSLVDDNNHDKATFDDDEFTKMECHSVKMSDDSDLLWDVVGVTDSSSSPSCVDNCSQHKCLDSDDDYEDDRVDGDERRSYNLTAAEFQLVRVLVQRFMEDKQFGGRRNDADVRSRCMIRSLLQVPAIEDDFVKTKAREERDGVEMLVGVISEMMVILFLIAFDPGGDVSMLLLSSTLPVVPWFPLPVVPWFPS